MRIAVDCRMNGLSGIGVYLDNIVDQWVAHKDQHVYTLLGDPEKLSRYASYANVKIVATHIGIFSWQEFFRFPCKEVNRCDVFYSPFYNLPAGITVPIFSTIHDVVFLDVEGLSGKMGTLIRKWFFQRAYRLSLALFTVSEFSKARIQHHLGVGKDIVVTYSAINDGLKSFHCPVERYYDFEYILFIGNIKKQKGLGWLLRAYKLSRENGYTPKLVIVGDNKNFKTVDREISKLLSEQQDSDIIYTGKISNNELYQIIKQALLLVQPSTYEGFGLPPLEALYLGCNVLISDIPVFREIYDNLPVTYFERDNLADFADKIQKCSTQEPVAPTVRKQIDGRYNFERASDLIMSHMESCMTTNSPKSIKDYR